MSDKEKKPRKKVIKEEGAPEKCKSAYLHFCAQERKNMDGEGLSLKNKEIIAELGGRWTRLKDGNPSKFEEFQKIAASDKERYFKEKEAWQKTKVEAQTEFKAGEGEGEAPKKKKGGGRKSKKAEEPEASVTDEVVVTPAATEEVSTPDLVQEPVEKKKAKKTKK